MAEKYISAAFAAGFGEPLILPASHLHTIWFLHHAYPPNSLWSTAFCSHLPLVLTGRIIRTPWSLLPVL